jgi:hypothetical protein
MQRALRQAVRSYGQKRMHEIPASRPSLVNFPAPSSRPSNGSRQRLRLGYIPCSSKSRRNPVDERFREIDAADRTPFFEETASRRTSTTTAVEKGFSRKRSEL